MAGDLRAIVHASLLTPSPLERYRAGPVRRATHGCITLIAGGEPGPDFNTAIVLGPVPSDHLLALAEAFFTAGERYSIVIEAGTAASVEAELAARGWSVDEEEPAMALASLPPAIPAPPPDLQVHRVANDAGLHDFRVVRGTGMSSRLSLAAALDPQVALFAGYLDGQPVATARLVCLERVAEISSVATLPEQRRRGFGTAMTWAAAVEGATRGCTATMLSATAMGYPVYLRMGFVPACVYRTYLLPEAG